MKGYCEKCKKVIDETECYRFSKWVVCYGCLINLNQIYLFLKLDFFRADYFLTRKESRPYLCQICKLNETCRNNFDYECVEASDFLFKPNNILTVKDDFLDSLVIKSHVGLRDKTDDIFEKNLTNQLTKPLDDTILPRILVYIMGIGLIFLFLMFVLFVEVRALRG